MYKNTRKGIKIIIQNVSYKIKKRNANFQIK